MTCLKTVLVSQMMFALCVPTVALAAPGSNRAARAEEGFTLTFVDADARRVVDAVLGEMLGADYAVEPDVSGNITLRTAKPVTKAELVPLLEQALSSVNAVILFQGNRYRVLSRDQARGRALPAQSGKTASVTGTPIEGDQTPGYVSEIITLKFSSAREMARLIEQFLGKDIISSRNDALSQIVIAGTGDERRAAKDIIARFDIDSLAQMTYQMYRLDNVDAVVLMGELEKVFAPPYDIIGSRIRLIPLPRLRSLLAVASDRTDLARIEPWIRKLDVGASGTRKLYSYVVQNARARDLARALQQVLTGSGSSMQGQDFSQQPQNATSSLASPKMAALAGTTTSGGTGSDASAAPAASVTVSAQLPLDSGSLVTSSTGVRIVPNEANNSLLIYADSEEYALIKDALAELDLPVAQVLIEATLAEVTLGNDLQYGVDFRTISGNTTFTNTATTSGVPAASFPGFSASVISSSTTAILNTLQSRTDVRVLSAPRLFVLNNQVATLQVGDQVPIVTQQSQSVAAPGAPVVNTVELRDTGVILQVTPRVNQSGVVTLDIAQEVSDVARTTTSGINSPTIQQRRLTSTVATRSGQVVALGGLIRDRTNRTKSGVPLLSQIPVIGGAFGTQSRTNSRTELIILLKPTVIRSPDEVKGTVNALIDGLELARPLVDQARTREIGGRPALAEPGRR